MPSSMPRLLEVECSMLLTIDGIGKTNFDLRCGDQTEQQMQHIPTVRRAGTAAMNTLTHTMCPRHCMPSPSQLIFFF